MAKARKTCSRISWLAFRKQPPHRIVSRQAGVACDDLVQSPDYRTVQIPEHPITWRASRNISIRRGRNVIGSERGNKGLVGRPPHLNIRSNTQIKAISEIDYRANHSRHVYSAPTYTVLCPLPCTIRIRLPEIYSRSKPVIVALRLEKRARARNYTFSGISITPVKSQDK